MSNSVTGAVVSDVPAADTEFSGGYKINNNYLYPRFTDSAFLRQKSPNANPGIMGNTNTGTGLMRGWIYPVDVSQAQLTAAEGAETAEGIQDALARVREEEKVHDAAILAALVAGVPGAYRGVSPVGADSSLVGTYPDAGSIPKQIRYREGKQFQFNPGFLEYKIDMTNSAPAETLSDKGTAGNSQVGAATTSIQLFFDRSIETHAATVGLQTVNGHRIDPIFADIGVQKDLWDVYRIILGGDKDYWSNIGNTLINISDVSGTKVRDGSITDMSNRLFDLGFKGSSAYGRRIVLFFNSNIVILGDVNAVGFVYAQFNANYIPTMAKIDLTLSVLASTSESGVETFTDPNATTLTDTDSGSSGGSTPSATKRVVTTVGRNTIMQAV